MWRERVGIIPALAGNTCWVRSRCLGWSDHPRSRGEYRSRQSEVRCPRGSSPLSRGIPGLPVLHPRAAGIIPALAGNTASWFWAWPRKRDHPRSRGEYSTRTPPTPSPRGSSPLSRGILRGSAGNTEPPRIIPALAGNTPTRPESDDDAADHPRSRGEYRHESRRGDAGRGSSPLSRGIPPTTLPWPRPRRIIPALAGNTRPGWRLLRWPPDHPRSRGEYPAGGR